MGWIEKSPSHAKPCRAVVRDPETGRRFTRSLSSPRIARLWITIFEADEMTAEDVAALNAETEG